jgi:hypothetical protein
MLNPINRTEHQINNTGMTANAGTEGKQEGNLNTTSKSKNVPLINHI